ncbi:MAG: MBL fold metallo-hydrolase, partial [Desulfurococcales archaeon]|nr:MBL fold metallo-hydrolase [Desulfurococcales archaeon]
PQSILFTGDAAGVSVELPEGRLRIPTTPPPFKADLYLESLQKMARLNPQKIAPTHYGIDPKPGTEYLNDHILQTRAWLQTIEDLVRSGVTTVDEAAKKLAEKLPEARLAANTTNKIIYITFYTSTVWGMLEYIKEKLKTQK